MCTWYACRNAPSHVAARSSVSLYRRYQHDYPASPIHNESYRAAPRPQPYCEFYADTPVTFISQHYDDVDLFPIYSELFKGNCEKE